MKISKQTNKNLGYSLLITFFCVWLGFIPHVSAQTPLLSVYGQQHYGVRSYDGIRAQNTQNEIHIQLPGPINLENWSISAKIDRPLISSPANVSGRMFPEDKIKIRLLRDQIDYNAPHPQPNLQNLDAPMSDIPFQPAGANTTIINRAKIPLQSMERQNLQLRYYYGIDIEGGLYLADMLSEIGGHDWDASPALYESSITITLFDELNNEIVQASYPFRIQVHRPLGNPPVPDYSLQIVGQARDGQLNFQNISSYLNGASATYDHGVKVNSKTGFQIQVKSVQENLTNDQGAGLPVDLLKINLLPATDAIQTAQFPRIALSTNAQTILSASGGSNKTQFYDLRYSTDQNDQRVLNVKAGTYSTHLIYQLIPQ